MASALQSSLGTVAYLALFLGVGFLFLFAALLFGRLVRPVNPTREKSEIYECGEPPIGSAFVQFDLRFYVVALLFIVFDVEVALFFPWATVFGKALHLADRRLQVVQTADDGQVELTTDGRRLYRELGVTAPEVPRAVPPSLSGSLPNPAAAAEIVRNSARQLAWVTIVDIGLFFAVLLVGFAYVWRRGDLDWVRALAKERALAG
jgi:NADH-quinone oxidoreductase subunit A